jgi:hypothetical protein
MKQLTKEQLENQVVDGTLIINVSTGGTIKQTPEDEKILVDGIKDGFTPEAREWFESAEESLGIEIIINILD